MNSPEDKKPSQLLSSPIAKKHVNLDDYLVTPCPKKYAKINHDDPFIDDRKPSSMSSPTSKTDYSQHTLIPVTAKMKCSAVSTFDRFQLKDGHLLHLVKPVGTVTFYHEYTDNITIDVEDGTGTMHVVQKHNQMECSVALSLCRNCRGNGYIHVIGTVHDVFGIREIIALGVCPVLSGNELTYNLLEVAYSFDKVIHDTQDDELGDEFEAVDLEKNCL
jgi:hypothetical protein